MGFLRDLRISVKPTVYGFEFELTAWSEPEKIVTFSREILVASTTLPRGIMRMGPGDENR
jgi:hypothetical protein